MLAPAGWSTSSLAVPILTTTSWIDLCRRPSLFTIRLAMLNAPVHLSLAADTGLWRNVENGVIRSYVCPLIDNFTQIYYAAQPNSSTRSFSTPSSIIRNKAFLTTVRTQLDIDQKRLIEYFAVACLKELHADNEARGAAVRLAGLISPSFWSH